MREKIGIVLLFFVAILVSSMLFWERYETKTADVFEKELVSACMESGEKLQQF